MKSRQSSGEGKELECAEFRNGNLNNKLVVVHRGRFMTNQARILVIEDEPGVSMMMVHVLTQAGCEVQTAWSAEKGLRLAQTEEFDLITLNVNLPGVSGFEVCRQLKQNPRISDTPIVLVSRRSSEQDVQRGLELGAVDYITKPFDAMDFVSQILSHVGQDEEISRCAP
jgi:DNA-binding response OmpR family regulator